MFKKLFVICFIFIGLFQSFAQNSEATPIQQKLDSIWKSDQEIRFELIRLQQEGKTNSEEFKDLIINMKKQDSLNLIEVKSILDNGWPENLTIQGNQTLFLVIQHSDLETQKKYLPAIEQAVAENKTLPSNLALLKDRIALREGDKQIYGSQVFIDSKTGKKYVEPIKNPEKVDSLRADVGLPPMKVYLIQSFQMNWDLEQYYENLPQLKKLKEEKSKRKE